MNAIARGPLVDAIAARLAAVSGATGFFGQVGRTLDGRLDVDPPTKSGTDLRVQPYFIFFPGPGAPGDQRNFCQSDPDLTWSCQVTAAAGDVADLTALVDRLEATLQGWTPSVPGLVCGPLRTPEGLDLGPFRTDHAVNPPRLYVPLQYSTTVTA